jgi:hypothetical protein
MWNVAGPAVIRCLQRRWLRMICRIRKIADVCRAWRIGSLVVKEDCHAHVWSSWYRCCHLSFTCRNKIDGLKSVVLLSVDNSILTTSLCKKGEGNNTTSLCI